MEAGYSCFAELGGDIGELGEIGEPACQQLGGFGDHLDLLSHEVLEAEAEDEDEDDRLISLDSGDSSSRQLQGEARRIAPLTADEHLAVALRVLHLQVVVQVGLAVLARLLVADAHCPGS